MGWEYENVTKYKAEFELLRGQVSSNSYRNDQLHIWVRREDNELLGNRLASWFFAKEENLGNYSKMNITIQLDKTFPMALIYHTVDDISNRLIIEDKGNFFKFESARVIEYNNENAEQINSQFNYTADNLYDAFKLGRSYQKYTEMLISLGYINVSTVESGLLLENE